MSPLTGVSSVTVKTVSDQLAAVKTCSRKVELVKGRVTVKGDGGRMNPRDQRMVYDALKGVRKYRSYDRTGKSFYVDVRPLPLVEIEAEVTDGR